MSLFSRLWLISYLLSSLLPQIGSRKDGLNIRENWVEGLALPVYLCAMYGVLVQSVQIGYEEARGKCSSSCA